MNSSASELPEGSCISRFGVNLRQENWKGARVMVVGMVDKVRSCDYGGSDDASDVYNSNVYAGITKLVNGAGLLWNIHLINRIQDLFIIISVD